jgi:hypothetical protein
MSALFEDGPRWLKHVTNKGGGVLLTLMHLYFDVLFYLHRCSNGTLWTMNEFKTKEIRFFFYSNTSRYTRSPNCYCAARN